MLRLPPTSVSLSDNDVSLHLQQIDLYYSLLKQGFKKEDILRWFEEDREAKKKCKVVETNDSDKPLPNTVELAVRGPVRCNELVAVAVEPSEHVQANTDRSNTTNCIHTSEDSTGFETVPPAVQPHQHAPRKSSLLRFARLPSAEPSDDSESGKARAPIQDTLSLTQEWNTRTSEYSYDSAKETEKMQIVQRLSELYIDSTSEAAEGTSKGSTMRPEAEVFVPRQNLTEPETIIGTTADSASSHFLSSPESETHIQQSQSTSDLVSHTTPKQRTSMGQLMGSSSSPTPSTDPSISLPQIPVTPTRRPVPQAVRSEPRRQQFHNLDGASFSVYDDSMPAFSQPQTPADLSRRPLITETDAAYTAPPGMFRSYAVTLQERTQHATHTVNRGEPSPTQHALGVRERRERELRRSARLAATRMERLRMQDQDRIARGLDGRDERTNGPGPALYERTAWREELEEDRVGEENWEAEMELMVRDDTDGREMRVLSGNARWQLWRID